jgi:RNA polymerase sigma-70 factor (ECF subfamily)
LAKTPQDDRAVELAELHAVAAGDQAAFARLIGRESPRLLRFVGAILGSAEEAEDVVQEALLKLWEVAEAWTPDARIGTWLHTVCYNRAVDRLRRRRKLVDESVLEGIADESDGADALILRDEAGRSVRAAIDALPARQRSAILLFHFQDLPQSEAARVLGVSESAFESLLARARRQMKQILSAAGGDHD